MVSEINSRIVFVGQRGINFRKIPKINSSLGWRRQLILGINLVVCFSRNLSVIFDLSERRIRRDLIHFGALEAINSGINLIRDFGFNHTVSEADLWSRWLKSLGLQLIAKINWQELLSTLSSIFELDFWAPSSISRNWAQIWAQFLVFLNISLFRTGLAGKTEKF